MAMMWSRGTSIPTHLPSSLFSLADEALGPFTGKCCSMVTYSRRLLGWAQRGSCILSGFLQPVFRFPEKPSPPFHFPHNLRVTARQGLSLSEFLLRCRSGSFPEFSDTLYSTRKIAGVVTPCFVFGVTNVTSALFFFFVDSHPFFLLMAGQPTSIT